MSVQEIFVSNINDLYLMHVDFKTWENFKEIW